MSRQSWWFPFICGVWSLFVWSMWSLDNYGRRNPGERIMVMRHEPSALEALMCAPNPCIPFR